jgi:antagonist of KipI
MSRVAIISPGVQSLVQDLGRPGHGASGVPRGGAADALSLQCGNVLLGNPAAAPAIEMAMLGAEVRFDAIARCCLAGAPNHALLVDAGGSSRSVPRWTAFEARPGQRLVVKAIRPGLRAYLCVAGGVQVPACLGSASTLLSCAMGGFRGRALRAGDELDIGPAPAATAPPVASAALAEWLEATLRPGMLRVVATPDGEGACRVALKALLASPLVVSRHSDRVGVRLEPTPEFIAAIRGEASGRTPSAGMTHGAIELTPGGEPIILGVDHPTTGGYPVVACVIAADLPALGQLAPGDVVRLARVDRDEARRAHAACRAMFAKELRLP